jgi:hypothetical protein
MLASGRGGDQIKWARAESVRSTGERTNRTDLHSVAREIRLERILLVNADLLKSTALIESDEWIAGDLI